MVKQKVMHSKDAEIQRKIKIERKIISQYLNLVDFEEIDPINFEIVEIPSTETIKFYELENLKKE